jgi:hypothetical protein
MFVLYLKIIMLSTLLGINRLDYKTEFLQYSSKTHASTRIYKGDRQMERMEKKLTTAYPENIDANQLCDLVAAKR